MPVHLRPVTRENLHDCLALQVAPEQTSFVASVAKSLAEAYVDPNLQPYAVYDESARGHEATSEPVVGFAMVQIVAGVGFVQRLLIGADYQKRGYGRATMLEMIRRLRMHPDVETVATSHRKGNQQMARLCKGLGFVPWEIDFATSDGLEVFLIHEPAI